MFKTFLPKSVLLLVAVLSFSGCTYSSKVDYGNQFTSEQVAQIKKNKTTSTELLQIFGEPSIKSVLNETEEKWVYSYTGGTGSVQTFTMKTTSDMSTHMLDILIRDGVVINFAETNTTHNMNVSTQ
ncbi:outer membrane protein assembly factor BamE domain-containing protein [Colwellia polaris]|jgi:outer membrane protein assembly factor BamE (lipoprotein component of BamABCDE complex)|uniref:outer membrane protein assembly factor BamE domain-containing protein n=1 Tax=Colwellia polaris TaxID=326537 RepID=UPI000A1706DF|nr:outer membrane protein assembly factor BamE [Colwellia polaris]|tara:strand:- start:16405 stop:16782 length:378 start_codon:yes stop_codon:yes gene_type:complete